MSAEKQRQHSENVRIEPAGREDSAQILALYRSMLYGPAQWNEYYPSEDTIEFDLSRNALFVMKNDQNEIIAVISIDQDEEVDALPCWSEELLPGGEISRICVRKEYQKQGLAAKMVRFVMEVLKQQKRKSIHLLVVEDHTAAIGLYSGLGFQTVGTCEMYEKHFLCMERPL